MCTVVGDSLALKSNHNFARFEASLRDAILSEQLPLGFLLGAGCPVAINGAPTEDDFTPLIPAIAGMTTKVENALKADSDTSGLFLQLMNQFEEDAEDSEPNVEELLSRVRGLKRIVGNGQARGLNQSDLETLETRICEEIAKIVSVKLPGSDTPYNKLSSWITSVRREHPIEIFTTNYDRLLEQALEEGEVPFFDGFVGNEQRFFDLHAMEKDSLPTRWARVWKLHGSVNWQQRDDGRIICSPNTDDEGLSKLLIHPSHLKYSQSRRMPYLAMQDRLIEFLEKSGSVLFTVGYSFSDEHLNELIFYTLRSNPASQTFALMFEELDNLNQELLTAAQRLQNLAVICPDAGVFDRRPAQWSNPETSVQYGDFATFGNLFDEVTGLTRESNNGK